MIDLPVTTNPASLIIPQRTSAEQSIPAAILNYLESLATVEDQFAGQPLSVCSQFVVQNGRPSLGTPPIPEPCVSLTSICSGTRNLTSICATSTITRSFSGPISFTSAPPQTTLQSTATVTKETAHLLTTISGSAVYQPRQAPVDVAPTSKSNKDSVVQPQSVHNSPAPATHQQPQAVSTPRGETGPSRQQPSPSVATTGHTGAGQQASPVPEPSRDTSSAHTHVPPATPPHHTSPHQPNASPTSMPSGNTGSGPQYGPAATPSSSPNHGTITKVPSEVVVTAGENTFTAKATDISGSVILVEDSSTVAIGHGSQTVIDGETISVVPGGTAVVVDGSTHVIGTTYAQQHSTSGAGGGHGDPGSISVIETQTVQAGDAITMCGTTLSFPSSGGAVLIYNSTSSATTTRVGDYIVSGLGSSPSSSPAAGSNTLAQATGGGQALRPQTPHAFAICAMVALSMFLCTLT